MLEERREAADELEALRGRVGMLQRQHHANRERLQDGAGQRAAFACIFCHASTLAPVSPCRRFLRFRARPAEHASACNGRGPLQAGSASWSWSCARRSPTRHFSRAASPRLSRRCAGCGVPATRRPWRWRPCRCVGLRLDAPLPRRRHYGGPSAPPPLLPSCPPSLPLFCPAFLLHSGAGRLLYRASSSGLPCRPPLPPSSLALARRSNVGINGRLRARGRVTARWCPAATLRQASVVDPPLSAALDGGRVFSIDGR